MGKIISYIAVETCGKSFNSYRYKHENIGLSTIQYDDLAEYNLKYIGETDIKNNHIDLTSYSKEVSNKDRPIFVYFLDGSRRTFKIDDISYNNEIFPIIAGQVCVACCKRENRTVKSFKLTKQNVIALPNKSLSEWSKDLEINRLIKEINKISSNIKFEKILVYKTDEKEKLEDKAVAKIQMCMMDEEQNMVKELMNDRLLSQNRYLLKDGSLEYKNRNMSKDELYKFKEAYKYVIGVSKSFNPANCIDKKGNVITKLIAELPLYHRTPVSRYEDKETKLTFAVWYIRIRDIKYTNDVFSGILKIEKILVTDSEEKNGIDSKEVDLISANIINERNPVCYGSDKRWANHLYPVYMTEQYAKSQYLSNQMFLNIF